MPAPHFPPLHLICDGLPSQGLKTQYVLRTVNPSSLWIYEDSNPAELRLVAIFGKIDDSNHPEFLRIMANVTKEVSAWYHQYCDEADQIAADMDQHF